MLNMETKNCLGTFYFVASTSIFTSNIVLIDVFEDLVWTIVLSLTFVSEMSCVSFADNFPLQ